MKAHIFLVFLCIIVSLGGCATTEASKRNEIDYFMYTNAPRDVVFNASQQALLNKNYSIDIIDKDNYLVKGVEHYKPCPPPLCREVIRYAVIEVTEETAGAKVTVSIGCPETIVRKEFDIFGGWRRIADNIFNEIDKILSQKGYKAQKSR